MTTPLNVFSSYAHEDQAMLEQLAKHLKPLQRQGQIALWSGLNIHAGSEPAQERSRHLEHADLILLLISPDFMSSDYCFRIEMVQAIERYKRGNAHIIPILLRPTHWENTPVAAFEMIPTGASPVTRWHARDDAFHDIIGHIQRVIRQLRNGQKQETLPADESPWDSHRLPIARAPLVSMHRSLAPLRLHSARSGAITLLHRLTGHTGTVHHLALSADGQMLASCSTDHTLKLWNARTGQARHTLLGSAHTMVLSSDGQLLASYGADHTLKLWNIQTSKLLSPVNISEQKVHALALSADGQTLVSSGNLRGKYTIKLWHVPTRHLFHTFKGDASGRHCTALSANGQILASGGSFHGKQMIKLWDVQTGKLLHSLKAGGQNVQCLALSADGQMLSIGSSDWTITLWHVPTGELLRTLTGLAWHLAAGPDGILLASSGSDQAIKLWHVPTGELLCVLKGHTGEVHSLAFSPDGCLLASGGEDGIINVWGMKKL